MRGTSAGDEEVDIGTDAAAVAVGCGRGVAGRGAAVGTAIAGCGVAAGGAAGANGGFCASFRAIRETGVRRSGSGVGRGRDTGALVGRAATGALAVRGSTAALAGGGGSVGTIATASGTSVGGAGEVSAEDAADGVARPDSRGADDADGAGAAPGDRPEERTTTRMAAPAAVRRTAPSTTGQRTGREGV